MNPLTKMNGHFEAVETCRSDNRDCPLLVVIIMHALIPQNQYCLSAVHTSTHNGLLCLGVHYILKNKCWTIITMKPYSHKTIAKSQLNWRLTGLLRLAPMDHT